MIKFSDKKLPDMNIGLVGHVDHGKTTLTKALTGKWTDTHSEELKRGITIRLGYADAKFYKCSKCNKYVPTDKCKGCMEKGKLERTISIVDAPGHETLMATVLSGASLMDAALLVIAANEKCPQPQTAEHLKALEVAGIKNIILVQNKVDLASKKEAMKNYKQIKQFIKGTVAEDAPIIPVSAQHNTNISILIETILEKFKPPKRNLEDDPQFLIARSFDVNKPGTDIDKLKGGVIGGSLMKGKIKKGQEIEIKPIQVDGKWTSVKTKVENIMQGNKSLDEGTPGGLVALQTALDPALTRSDGMVGKIGGVPGKLPDIKQKITFKPDLFDTVMGVKGHEKVEPLNTNDTLMLTSVISKTVGVVSSAQENVCEVELKLPLCVNKGQRVAISKQIKRRWHLIGVGTIQ